ncbi:hypothetical protein C8R44DRAFT_754544 [Mycena epipterygia]|nr:hypothetical protein C8R44DRAFT_754544 [Mycena epipterygia]
MSVLFVQAFLCLFWEQAFIRCICARSGKIKKLAQKITGSARDGGRLSSGPATKIEWNIPPAKIQNDERLWVNKVQQKRADVVRSRVASFSLKEEPGAAGSFRPK